MPPPPAPRRAEPLPDPMLASAGRPSGDPTDWVGEFKWDGVRAIVGVEPGGGVRVRSRRGADASTRYPELAGLAGAVTVPLVLDGEVVALDDGRPSFARLQRRMHVADPPPRLVAEVPVVLHVFDLLAVDGEAIVDLPWGARRSLLESVGLDAPGWRVPPAVGLDEVNLDALLGVAAQHGLEGVVAKRRGGRYRPGRRSDDWRKVRLQRRQEFVVVGYQVARRGSGLGSLLLAVHDRPGGALVAAGSAGSGLTAASATDWQRRLDAIALDGPPLVESSAWGGPETYRWARPELVAEVRFTEWTPEGRLRQPVLLGRRDDRDPSTVVRES